MLILWTGQRSLCIHLYWVFVLHIRLISKISLHAQSSHCCCHGNKSYEGWKILSLDVYLFILVCPKWVQWSQFLYASKREKRCSKVCHLCRQTSINNYCFQMATYEYEMVLEKRFVVYWTADKWNCLHIRSYNRSYNNRINNPFDWVSMWLSCSLY